MRSLFVLFTAPLRRLVSECFRPPTLNCTSVGDPVEIATWPQYGNKSYSRVSGFTQVNSSCSVSPVDRRLVSSSLGLQDVPYDFLTSSISGATISISGRTSPLAISGQHGHFDAFVGPPLPRESNLTALTAQIPGDNCRLSTFFLPAKGLTIVSDVDDTLRELKIWNLRAFLSNAFGTFKPWRNIDEVYRDWEKVDPSIHFHYVTDAPETSWRPYLTFLGEMYPLGTYDFRPLEFNSWKQITTPRYENIKRLIETFPNRTYMLVGDTTPGSVVSAYTKLAREFSQIQCVLIRDVQFTERSNWMVPNLSQLRRLGNYMLFAEPDDIRGTVTDMLERQSLRVQTGHTANYTCSSIDTGSISYPKPLASIVSLWRLWIQYAECLLQSSRPSPLCPFDQEDGKMMNSFTGKWYPFRTTNDLPAREWYGRQGEKLRSMGNHEEVEDEKQKSIKRDEL